MARLIDFYIDEKKQFSEDLVLKFTMNILKGLAELHKLNIIHRDIKPKNLFLRNNQIVIGDLGVAVSLESVKQSDHMLKSGGTYFYMAPEVIGGYAGNYDNDSIKKTDIWSLACVIYELFTLKKAYEGNNLTIVNEMILNGRVPEIEGSVILRSLLNRMFKKMPQIRPSAEELLAIINELITEKNTADRNIIDNVIYMTMGESCKPKTLNDGKFLITTTIGKQNMLSIAEDINDNQRFSKFNVERFWD